MEVNSHVVAEIEEMLKFAFEHRNDSKIMEISQNVLEMSKQAGYELGVMKSKVYAAISLSQAGKNEQAMEIFSEAYDYFIVNDEPEYMAIIYNNFGIITSKKGNLSGAIDFFQKGYQLALKKDLKLAPYFANNIGGIYEQCEKLTEAVTHYQIAADSLQADDNIKSTAFINIATCYLKMNMPELAESFAQKAYEFSNDCDYIKAEALLILADLYHSKGENKQAILSIEESIKYGTVENTVYAYIRLGQIYRETNFIDKAKEYFIMASEGASSIALFATLGECHYYLSEIYSAEKDFEQALKHYKVYVKNEKAINVQEAEQRLNQYKQDMDQEAFKESSAMIKIGQELTATLNLSTVTGLIYKYLKTIMDADVFGIAIFNAKDGIIDYKFFVKNGVQLSLKTTTVDDSQSLAAECIRKRELLIRQKPADTKSNEYNDEKISQSVIYHPLIVMEEVIGVMTVQSYQPDAYKDRQIRLMKALSSYIAIALNNSMKSDELKITAEKLEITVQELKDAQEQLIHSEKMAALGQLVAGVAHEINTPFGAIQASNDNIRTYLNNLVFQKLPLLIRNLDEEQLQLFLALLGKAAEDKAELSSREARQLRRSIEAILEQQGNENAKNIAEFIVGTGIQNEYQKYQAFISHKDGLEIFKIAYEFSDLFHNSTNINTAVSKVSKIIYALKSYSFFDASSEVTLTSIEDSIDNVLELYFNSTKHGVEIHKNYELQKPLLCYPDELQQVWTNLISNGLQAMEYSGILEINTYQEGDKAVVRITDSGCGIPEEIKEHIFKPFFTTKKQGEGTGLGLEIVKRIVERHNGSVEVESQPGKTSFYIKLPL